MCSLQIEDVFGVLPKCAVSRRKFNTSLICPVFPQGWPMSRHGAQCGGGGVDKHMIEARGSENSTASSPNAAQAVLTTLVAPEAALDGHRWSPKSPSFLKWMPGLADPHFLESHSLVRAEKHSTNTKARVSSFQAESRIISDCRRLFGSYS